MSSKRCELRVMRKYHVKRPRMVRREAKRAGLALSDGLTLFEQETGIPQQNIYGCDWGPGVLWCHAKVTKKNIGKLIRDGRAQGVGWTQITYQAFVKAAQAMGGAWKPKYQTREGFTIMAHLIDTNGRQKGHEMYNGSGPAAEAYGHAAMTTHAKWHHRFAHCHH